MRTPQQLVAALGFSGVPQERIVGAWPVRLSHLGEVRYLLGQLHRRNDLDVLDFLRNALGRGRNVAFRTG